MISRLLSFWTLFSCLPAVLKYFGVMERDTVALNEQGQPWNSIVDRDTEPVYTRQKPTDEVAAISGVACLAALYNIFD
jgi:hypothetical protein